MNTLLILWLIAFGNVICEEDENEQDQEPETEGNLQALSDFQQEPDFPENAEKPDNTDSSDDSTTPENPQSLEIVTSETVTSTRTTTSTHIPEKKELKENTKKSTNDTKLDFSPVTGPGPYTNTDGKKFVPIDQEMECLNEGGVCGLYTGCPDYMRGRPGLCPNAEKKRGPYQPQEHYDPKKDAAVCCYGQKFKETRCWKRYGVCIPKTAHCPPNRLFTDANDCGAKKKCCMQRIFDQIPVFDL